MEDDNATQSRPSPGGSGSPDPPTGLGTTVKSSASPPPPPPRNGLDLVVSPSTQAVTGRGSHGRSGGGGRDDCWSEEATEILIDAWGERFLELKRGNLKQQHWKEVAEIVNTGSSSKSPKTDIQCKNRIDTVKKKFKQEKAEIAAGADHGVWIFFKKLERLIGGAAATTSSKAIMANPLSSRSELYQRKAKSTALLQHKQQASVKRSGDSTRWHFRKRIASETESESEPDLSADSGEDSLPPLLPPPVKLDKTRGGGGRELGEVAMAIMGFAESYEKAETGKLKQMVELEKERMEFAKELELQRMQFFKSQLEMLRNIQGDGDGERRIKSRHSVKDNGNVS